MKCDSYSKWFDVIFSQRRRKLMQALFVDFASERVNATRMVYRKNSFHVLIVGIAVSLCLTEHSWDPNTERFVANMLKLIHVFV